RGGYRTVSAYLVVAKAREVVSFIQTVFGAEPVHPPIEADDGRMMHVALTVGDSVVMVGQPPEGVSEETAFMHVYVDDCDETYAAALEAGATSIMAPSLQPHGDRAGMVVDMAGNKWWIASFVEEVSHDEMMQRMASGGS
ncbi:MAG: VOC family protein, partial [Pseudomonadota bacterium]